VDQPIRKMGQRAVELLVGLIRGEQPDSLHVTLETNLIVRQSARVFPTP
jgi:LacI family transcriptional regulator